MTFHYFKKYKEYLVNPISTEQYNNIVYYLHRDWYLQLLKEYGILISLICLQYYIENENYKRCSGIHNAITISNKELNTDHPLTLKDYGIMS